LLFGLAAAFVVVGGLAFFVVQPWQVNRNAEWFRERAESAIVEDDLRTAFDYQSKYVRYREDEVEARVKLANLAVDISKLSDVTPKERGAAYSYLQDAVLKTNDRDLRRKFADMLINGGRPSDAIIHIDELLTSDPSNTELQALRVRSLFATKDYRSAVNLAYRLIGYDKKTRSFDPEKATAADQPEIYSLLATTLAEVNNKRDEARVVVDRMVEVNPDSHEAHYKRALFLQIIGEQEESNVSLAKAYELNPADADVLKLMGQVALFDKEYEKAEQYLTEGLETNPDDIVFYKLLALVELQQEKNVEAIDILDQGIKKFDSRRTIDLLLLKIDTLFQAKDIAAIEKEVEVLEDLKLPILEPLIDYQKARINWHNKQWAVSAKELRRLRPMLFQFADIQLTAGIMLGVAYENLGQFDLAAQAYDIVLQRRPRESRALAGRQRVANRTRSKDAQVNQGIGIDQLVRQMLTLPPNEQDWKRVDTEIATYIEKNELPESTQMLYQSHVFLQRKMYAEARQKIRNALEIDPENLSIRLAAVRIMWEEPDTDAEKAFETLDHVENTYGYTVKTRTLRAEMLAASDRENATQELSDLANGTESWTNDEKVKLFVAVGGRLLNLGYLDESHKFWIQAVQLAPNNLPIRMQLFDVALQKRDDKAMQDAQDKILELVQNKSDASYILTEVKRRIIGFGAEDVSREELLEARKMLDTAMQQRPEWNELHVLYGQLLLVLQQDFDIAIERLNDAQKYGPTNMKVLALHVQLLSQQGLFKEAAEKMSQMPDSLQVSLLGKVSAEVLLNTGKTEEAYEAALAVVEQAPESAATSKWFATLATQAGKVDEAADAWQKTIKLNPAEPDSWSQLIAVYAKQRDGVQLQRVLREAPLALDAEFIPLLTAKAYEIQGRWQNAENIYLTAYGDQITEIPRARRMADFYLIWRAANPANAEKASIYINHILRASYEGDVPAAYMPHVVWARRQAARLLAGTSDYKKCQKALRLLDLGKVDGKLPIEDQILRGEILASLKDPASQTQAIQIFANLRRNRQLNKKGTLLLAKLYHAVGDWEKSENLLLDALATYAADPEVRMTYVSLLIEHGEYTMAQSRLNRSKNSAENKDTYLRLQARLSFKKGDLAGASKALEELLPKNIEGSLDPTQLAALRGIAILATEYKNLDLAEKLYNRYVKAIPAAAFELTQFHALHGNTDLALEQMRQILPRHADTIVSLASHMLRTRRAEFGDKLDEDVNRLIAIALRDDPDSAHRMLNKAEVLEIQQNYDESIAAYDKLLQRDDVPERVRAAASNNLAFILALKELRLDEAESLVNLSMEYFGPQGSLLDTRGVVRIAKKQYDLAVEDLRLAITIDKLPLTLYHLAKALHLAGDKEAAQEHWQEAQKLGLKKEDIPVLEQSAYDLFAGKIQQL